MLYLLSPARVVLYPSVAARYVRGGSGSITVHALTLLVLSLAGTGTVTTAAIPGLRGPVISTVSSLGPSIRREPEAPFEDNEHDRAPATIPLTVRDYVSGDSVTIDLARIRQRRNDLDALQDRAPDAPEHSVVAALCKLKLVTFVVHRPERSSSGKCACCWPGGCYISQAT